MGGHYGSVQVRSEQRQAVMDAAAEVMRARHIKCLVGPVINGWIGIYPENGGQDQLVGEAIAQRLGGEVIHLLVHDDSVMAYWYWRHGELIDSFWSKPGYFGEEELHKQEEMTGRADLLAQMAPAKERELRELLKRDGDGFAFEFGRLEQIAKILGIANAVSAYEYLKGGETTRIEGWKQFVELPKEEVAREENQRRSERRRVDGLIRQLKDDGVVLSYVSRKEAIPRAAVTDAGFVVAWEAMPGQQRYVEQFVSPFRAGEPVAVDVTPQVNSIAHDARGDRVAMALGNRVVAWSTRDWQPIVEVAESDWAITVTPSADGRLLAHSSRLEIVVSEIDTGRRVAAYAAQVGQAMAWHPSGKWLVAAGSRRTLLVLGLTDGEQIKPRELCVGGQEETSAITGSLLPGQVDAVDMAEMEQKARATFETALKQMQSMMKLDAQKLGEMRELMEKQWKMSLAAMSGASEHRAPALQGNEQVMAVGFSADGHWLWCGTNKGLRVYAWEDVVSVDGEEMPVAKWQFNPPEAEESGFDGYVYAAAEIADRGEIVFGGLAGKLYRMSLATGSVQELMTMPESASVISLHVSRDGMVLGVAGRKLRGVGRGSNSQQGHWSTWSYPAVCGRAS